MPKPKPKPRASSAAKGSSRISKARHAAADAAQPQQQRTLPHSWLQQKLEPPPPAAAAATAAAEPADAPPDAPLPPLKPAATPAAAAPADAEDPGEELKAAAAARGLVSFQYAGTRRCGEVRPLPPAVAEELLALAALNMSGFDKEGKEVGGDATPSHLATAEARASLAAQRREDMLNPRTRVLVLRTASAGATDAATAASISSDGGGELAGFASYRCVSQETVPVVYLLELHLAPAHRRRGLGSLLLGAVRAFGVAARRHGLMLTVHLDNASARAFYAAAGLEVSPVSPARCAPPGLPYTHHILQQLWEPGAAAALARRGEATRHFLAQQATKRAEAAKRAKAKAAARAAVVQPPKPSPGAGEKRELEPSTAVQVL